MSADIFFTTLRAVAEALAKAGVPVLLIGGLAVNQYGYTRATVDVDFLLAADDLELKLRQLCDQYGNDSLYGEICKTAQALINI